MVLLRDLQQYNFSNTIPSFLLHPLLKCNTPSPDCNLKGYHSGRRSALIEGEDHSWYRLKGCGDISDGIILKELEDSNGSLVQLRGVQFEHTTAREICIILAIVIRHPRNRRHRHHRRRHCRRCLRRHHHQSPLPPQ